jgi:uncharacterized protein DUF3313
LSSQKEANMNFRTLVAASLALLAAVTVATSSEAANPDGLVAVHSRNLDELYLRPDANLASYRKVLIEPVRVGFHRDWLRYGYTANPARPVGEDNVRRIAAGIANDAQASIAEAFKARGYEIVRAPGPGVLRLSPGIVDLYVNAPDRHSPWKERAFTREAGQAVLLLDASDSVSGALLGRVAHRGVAEQMGRFARASDVSNRFWFDALTRRWAANCAAELGPH